MSLFFASLPSPIQSTDAVARIVVRLAGLIPAASVLLGALGRRVIVEAGGICGTLVGRVPNAEGNLRAMEKGGLRVANLRM